tara:strand:+ start:485 stop:607 length:123 start_codon:yes stop_codon:yes gene_type:complete
MINFLFFKIVEGKLFGTVLISNNFPLWTFACKVYRPSTNK